MTTTRDLSWRYWAVTVVLLATGLSGHSVGIWSAILLCGFQIAHVFSFTHDFTAFPVQVRMVYLAMLIAGLREPLRWVHWALLAGSTVRVLAGHCFLARTLALAPRNRRQPLALALVRRTYLSLQAAAPSCGDVFRRMSLERVQA